MGPKSGSQRTIEDAHTRLHEMIRDLEKLDATIHLLDPSVEVVAIKRKAFRPPADWAKRGEMSRFVLGILRQAAEPLTPRDIALQMLLDRALDENDQRLLRLMTKRVGVSLRHKRGLGIVRSEQGPGQFMVWELVR